jgi:ubiquinol-cytochrome c reductase cytochrome b subunit
MKSKIIDWFTYRWPFKPVIKWSLEEEIPGGDSFWYTFGATTLFIFVLQVITGIWQLFYYVPNADHAYQSVSYLRYQVPFGWLIHGIHYWAGNAFIVLVLIHMLRVFIWGAYKAPRQLIWLVGVFLLFLVLAMSFTGALLPWDELGYWAAEVGTSIAGTVPVVGFFIKALMRGGASMDQLTLSRFFIAHVAIIPGILAGLIAFHVVAFHQFRSVGPWNEEKRKRTGFFWPQQVLKDLIVVSLLFILIVGLSAFFRAPVTGPADPLDNTVTPKPEWQFLFLYQFLKLFRGRWEPVGTVGVPLVLFLILFLLPFYDRNKRRSPLYRPMAMIGCFALIVWFLIFTILGYYSNPGASLTAKVSVLPQASASVKAGAELFASQGCIACHTVHGQGGNIGPNLSDIGSQGLSDQWLTTQIRDPKAHDPSTAMPSFSSLSDQQVNNLVDFLQSLGGSSSKSQSSPSSNSASQSAKSANEPNTAQAVITGGPNEPSNSSQSQSQTNQSASLINQGKSLFRSEGCIGCHTVDGSGGSVGPGLSNIGSKGLSRQWLMVQLQDPQKHDSSSIMLSFSSLSDLNLNALVTYLESLKGTSGQITSSQPSSSAAKSAATSQSSASTQQFYTSTEPNAATAKFLTIGEAAYSVGNPPHGEKLYNKNCNNCHGKDGKGGVSNPGTVNGKIPPLNPISEILFSKNPITFAENIDRYIQHGAIPKGPNPRQTMPAFGDNLKLTQQMIAEIEAYILELNNVDRAAIIYPGIQPYVFFAMTIGGYAIVVLIIIILWMRLANGRNYRKSALSPRTAESETGSSEEKVQSNNEWLQTSSEEDKSATSIEKYHKKQGSEESQKSSVAFAVFVIIVIAIIATAVMLIFSSFVTTKPIPSVTTQQISSQQENQSGISITNTSQSVNNQHKENED